jgi:DNA replication protein DnaC
LIGLPHARSIRILPSTVSSTGHWPNLLNLLNPGVLYTLERTNLIIIDDWGPEPLTADQRRDLLEIVDDRYDKGSLLITSQVPVSQWHDVIADPTLGDAILDRIIHNAHRIELKGDSLRRRAGEKKAA